MQHNIIDVCRAIGYIFSVIVSFKHPGLKALYEEGPSPKGLDRHGNTLARILSALDQATEPGEMDLPGFRLRELSGPLNGHYAASVTERQRVTFRFEDGQVADVDFTEHPERT